MKKVAFIFAFIVLAGIQSLFAQKVITGTVTGSEDGKAIPGVAVVVKGTTVGTVTDMDGKYSLTVPDNAKVLEFTFVGQKTQDIDIGSQSTIDLVMEPDVFGLDEVVVTGVASGTPSKKLGFAITKVDQRLLQEVPAIDASTALYGKVAGINVVQTQGDGAASVSLRGAKSVFGNISPLIIIDGILTTQGLGDINANDIDRIEVVKGAAASSMYGSLAAGGVIQIITKRGKKQKGLHINIRSEYGVSGLQKDYPAATKHPFQVNPDGSFVLSAGQRVLDTVNTWHDYPVLYDNIGTLMTNMPYQDNYFSITNSGAQYAFFGSFDYQSKGGIVEVLDPETRANVRMNFDFFPTQKFTTRISTSYTKNNYTPVSRNGQGTFFSTILLVEPFVNLNERDADGDYAVKPAGFDIQNFNGTNVLYQYSKWKTVREDQRFVAGIDLKYQFTDAFSASFNQSIDKKWYYSSTYYPKGYKTATNNPSLNNGNYGISTNRSSYSVTSAQLNYNKSFDNFNLGLVGKWLYEYRLDDGYNASGQNLTTPGIYDLGITEVDNRHMGSWQREYKTENFFVSADFDYRDKLILNGLVRRDGSSLFGLDSRWSTFYRGSLAYRITEDFAIPGFQELKARVSYGTSGRRPTWAGQYETYSVSSSSITGANLGNKDLKPAVNAELEVGLDGAFLQKYTFQINYAPSVVHNDFIWRNLSAVTGFNQQYQNIGAVKSNSFEIQFGANLAQSKTFAWDANLTFARIRSEVTDLGGIPPMTNGLYRREVGQPVGVFYGNKVMTSLDELTTDDQGYVNNAWNVGYDPNDMANNYTKDAFSVNDLGYVVLTDDIGTPNEQAIFIMDQTSGAKKLMIIGDRNADFKVGLANTFTFFNNLQLYVLLDWKQGGDKYNTTRQYMYFSYRHQDQVDWGEKGHHVNFSSSASSIYNANNYCSAFVEDATYLKIREVSLSYTFKNVVNFFDKIRLSAVGRNLFTFSKYNGYDPEGYEEYFPYPIFRTITGSIQVSF